MDAAPLHKAPQIAEIVSALGITLILCLVTGKVAKKIKIPQVTAYLLVGIVTGPSLFNLITGPMSHNLDFINKIAFGLILFNIGGEFNRDLLQKVGPKQIKYSLLSCALIVTIVGLLCFGLTFFNEMSMVERVVIALFLGFIAVESAPPTSMMVIREFNARGPVTQSIMVYLAVSTFVAIVGTEALSIILVSQGVWTGPDLSMTVRILSFIWSIAGSLIIGALLGFGLCLWEQKEKRQSELLFAVSSTILFGQAISHYLHVEPLLISLALGFTVVNASSTGKDIHKGIKDMGTSIYAIFFVLAGTHIDLGVAFKSLGMLGVGYIISRAIGNYFSSVLTSKIFDDNTKNGKVKGLSILSHAGAVLAIALKIKAYPETSAQTIVSIVMTSIFVFEIIGPLLMRFSLKKAGEIEPTKQVQETGQKTPVSFGSLISDFKENLFGDRQEDLTHMKNIKYLIRKDALAIQANTQFNEVTKFVKSHHSSIYPVVDENYKYMGVMSLETLENMITEKEDTTFIYALGLVKELPFINENSTFEEAMERFKETNQEVLPVVNFETKVLKGLISYKDVLMQVKSNEEEGKTSPLDKITP